MAASAYARRLLSYCMPESAGRLRRLNAFARALLALAAVSLMLTIAACSSNSTQNKSASAQVSSQQRLIEHAPIQNQPSAYRAASARQRPQWQSRRANRTLFARQPAPDCEYKGPEPNTVDAEQWARLKLDYERHCYQQAEMRARQRLDQLLASGKCRAESD
jgi:hypothetical protein